MNRSEIAVLRTKLRELNIEYSALVRGKTGEGRFVRMAELRVERRALMALIAVERLQDLEYHIAVCSSAGVLSLAAWGSVGKLGVGTSAADVCLSLPSSAAPATPCDPVTLSILDVG